MCAFFLGQSFAGQAGAAPGTAAAGPGLCALIHAVFCMALLFILSFFVFFQNICRSVTFMEQEHFLARAKPQAIARLQALAQHIADILPPHPIVVGLSGGADSSLLLLVARQLQEIHPGFAVRAVHCIHGLDADDPIWLAHCQKLCKRVGVPLTLKKLNIVYKNRESPEDSSRQERYRAMLEELHGAYLFLGHQRDDETESFFLALKRGSGPKGLSGMKEVTVDVRGTLVRPLLDLTKAQLEQLLAELGYDFVFDISNTYLKFERNFIRLKVLPLLRERFPSIDKAVTRTQKLCAQEHELAERLARPVFAERFSAHERSLTLDHTLLADEPLCLMVLRMFLLQYAEMPSELTLLEQARALMQGENGRNGAIRAGTSSQGTLWLRRFRDKLYVTYDYACYAGNTVVLQAGNTVQLGDFIYTLHRAKGAAEQSVSVPAVPEAVQQAEQVQLQFGTAGSVRLKPMGRDKSRELKKLYTEYNIPGWYRQALPIICTEQGEILGLATAFDTQPWGGQVTVYSCRDGRELSFRKG